MQFVPEALAVSIITIVLTAIAGYIFAIPRIKRQLEANLQQESEKIRQQFQADLQKEFSSRFNERKWETYEHFANIIRRLMENVSNKHLKQNQSKIIQELYGFTGNLWIIGGDNVIRAFNDWRRSAPSEDADIGQKMQMLILLMQIVIEMRKDLGYESSAILPEDLLRTFINDFDIVMARLNANPE
jgi:hypothetical protein